MSVLELDIAIPNGIIPANKKIICQLTRLYILFRLIQFVSKSAPTPIRVLDNIVKICKAASNTTPIKILKLKTCLLLL